MTEHDFLAKIGGRIRALRILHGLTQEKLAEKTDLHYKFLGNVESGKVNISITNLNAVAVALGIPVAHLLSFDRPVEIEAQDISKEKILKILRNSSSAELVTVIKILDLLR